VDNHTKILVDLLSMGLGGLQQVRTASLKWSYMMVNYEVEALESHLLNMFREEEAKEFLEDSQKVRVLNILHSALAH
jgi:hypothetical protein